MREAAPAVEEYRCITDPEEVKLRVEEAYKSLGYLLDDFTEPALLVDTLCHDWPVVGCSKGFSELTGFDLDAVLGHNPRMMLQNVPAVAICKSDREKLRSFCNSTRVVGLEGISEATSMQPNARKDGSIYTMYLMLALHVHRGHPFIIGVQRHLCEGLDVGLSSAILRESKEASRKTLASVKQRIFKGASDVPEAISRTASECSDSKAVGDSCVFSDRLEGHCMLMNQGLTVRRREPTMLPAGCLVFGELPTKRCDAGLYFAVRVDSVVTCFMGLPIFGFTKRKPTDSQYLYPAVSRYMAQSVCVGACGEAFARDKEMNLSPGFRPPSKDDLEVWALEQDEPSHRRKQPVTVAVGDILGCMYTNAGRIQWLQNGIKVLDFDSGRPIQEGVDYYAMLDICFTVAGVTILPGATPPPCEESLSYECDPVEDADECEKVWSSEASNPVQQAIGTAVSSEEDLVSMDNDVGSNISTHEDLPAMPVRRPSACAENVGTDLGPHLASAHHPALRDPSKVSLDSVSLLDAHPCVRQISASGGCPDSKQSSKASSGHGGYNPEEPPLKGSSSYSSREQGRDGYPMETDAPLIRAHI